MSPAPFPCAGKDRHGQFLFGGRKGAPVRSRHPPGVEEGQGDFLCRRRSLPHGGNGPCGLRTGRPCQSRAFCVQNIPSRSVAQHGSAPALGAGGRWFESSRSDHKKIKRSYHDVVCPLFVFAANGGHAAGRPRRPWEARPIFPCGRAWGGEDEAGRQGPPSARIGKAGAWAVRTGRLIPSPGPAALPGRPSPHRTAHAGGNGFSGRRVSCARR